jgi:flavin-dependent dehydrogenase
MQSGNVLIVGGGPAGSCCAWALRRAGLDVLLLDKADFPRHKVCAGWITPAVLHTLDIDNRHYADGRVLQPITGFRAGRIGGPQVRIDYGRPISYGIRRCEFDHYLLDRSAARTCLGEPAKTIQRDGADWVVNGRFRAPLLVGAGGHFCPVAALLGREADRQAPLVAAQEIEFRMDARQMAACRVEPCVPELCFCDDLAGYGWCFRKGDFLNVGLGREDRSRLSEHVARFCDWMKQQGRIPPDVPARFQGHAYYLYGRSPRTLLDDGVLLIGDAAGLAYAASGEGIRPAIESGLMAAGGIVAAGGDYCRRRLEPYRDQLTARFGRRKAPGAALTVVPSLLRRLIVGRLLASRWFLRRVLLDRCFLHLDQPPLPTRH